jgi:hypothetical protein
MHKLCPLFLYIWEVWMFAQNYINEVYIKQEGRNKIKANFAMNRKEYC